MSQKQHLLADGAYKYKKTAKKACKQVHRVLAGDPCYGKKNNKAGHRRESILRGAEEQALKDFSFYSGGLQRPLEDFKQSNDM